MVFFKWKARALLSLGIYYADQRAIEAAVVLSSDPASGALPWTPDLEGSAPMLSALSSVQKASLDHRVHDWDSGVLCSQVWAGLWHPSLDLDATADAHSLGPSRAQWVADCRYVCMELEQWGPNSCIWCFSWYSVALWLGRLRGTLSCNYWG